MENEQNIPKQLEETTQPTMGGRLPSTPDVPKGNRLYEAIFGPPNEDAITKTFRNAVLLLVGIGGLIYYVKKTKNK